MSPAAPALPETDLQSVASTRLLIEAVQKLSTRSSVAEIMEVVKSAARRGAGADGATFVLRDQGQCHYADEDAVSPLWKGRKFPMSTCVSGWAMIHRRAAVIPDIRLDPRIPQDAYRPTFVRSLVMMPIRSRDPIGAIGVYWSEPHHASEQVVEWLQALADATSAGLESIQAQDEVKRLANLQSGPGGMVRVCAWTKRVWHNGNWLTFEAFLHARFGLDSTHGISEEALAALQGDLDKAKSAPETLYDY